MPTLSRVARSLRRPRARTIVILSILLASILWLQFPFRSLLTFASYGVEGDHPIDRLVSEAKQRHGEFTAKIARNLAETARTYRERRGRHPPPGFDAWYELAKASDALVPESFFDQIYEDLEPFWGRDPRALRSFTEVWPHVLSVRNGKVHKRTENDVYVWLDWWKLMVEEMPFLPDVDLAVSPSDESRVILSFSDLSDYLEKANTARQEHYTLPLTEIRDDMAHYPELSKDAPGAFAFPVDGLQHFSPATYWDFIAKACKPDDPVFTEPQRVPSSLSPPTFSSNYTIGTVQGFVSNFTLSKNLCHNPNLRSLHGHIIAPVANVVYTELQPIFSAAKMVGVNNDILIPNPVQWTETGGYSTLSSSNTWDTRRNKAVWRGTASGGMHDGTNWFGFHRHRLVNLMNSTLLSMVEGQVGKFESRPYSHPFENLPNFGTPFFDWGTHNIPFPSRALFKLAAQTYSKLGEWSAELVEAAFTHFFCAPGYIFSPAAECPYLEPFYTISPIVPASEIDQNKYLPDVDGQTSSGRYRSFLQSLGVPIKASIFTEWYDARLVPWHHFVPMSGEFQEWFALLEYFLGYKATSEREHSVRDHDAVGERIGRQGSEWAKMVLRKEDMVLYFYRVILEYARVSSANRLHLGYVADL